MKTRSVFSRRLMIDLRIFVNWLYSSMLFTNWIFCEMNHSIKSLCFTPNFAIRLVGIKNYHAHCAFLRSWHDGSASAPFSRTRHSSKWSSSWLLRPSSVSRFLLSIKISLSKNLQWSRRWQLLPRPSQLWRFHPQRRSRDLVCALSGLSSTAVAWPRARTPLLFHNRNAVLPMPQTNGLEIPIVLR